MLAHALLYRLHACLHRGQTGAGSARAGHRRRLQQGREAQKQHRAHAAGRGGSRVESYAFLRVEGTRRSCDLQIGLTAAR